MNLYTRVHRVQAGGMGGEAVLNSRRATPGKFTIRKAYRIEVCCTDSEGRISIAKGSSEKYEKPEKKRE